MKANLSNDRPGGLLRLQANGAILEAPIFFQEALNLHLREVASIYHLFDASEAPYLCLSRIYCHPQGAMEFHLTVRGAFGIQRGFRYWHLAQEHADPAVSTFFIVDESSSLQHQEWSNRRQRRDILNDIQTSLSMHLKNRLAAVQVLTEMVRDSPQMANEISPRLLAAVSDLNYALGRVTSTSDAWNPPRDYQDLPIRLTDLASIMASWSMERTAVVCRTHSVDRGTLIAASSVERVILPVAQNALESSPRDSTIAVDITEVREGFAHIVIEDFGEGMSDRVRSRAEDPFFTTRLGHLGLGLSQAREALRVAGGQWKIESTPNVGTRFTILLPVTTAAHLFR
ncbi:MAG: sensor histidine kinase [Bradymonadaceae bacterium]|nr:sensor histidine kinase [Lujinxingiaceae bacterium]